MSSSTSGVFDSAEPYDYFFVVSDRVYVIVQTAWWLRFREFWAPATAATSGGGSTSGASSAGSSASGGSSTPTSGAGVAHSHIVFNWVSDTGAEGTQRNFNARSPTGTLISVDMESSVAATSLRTYDTESTHTHTVTIGAHDHTIAHNHTTPAHAHGLTYGLFREPMPGTINVNIGIYRKDIGLVGGWTLEGSVSGITEPETWLDLSQWVDRSGLWRLAFQSAAGQPNGGRLTVDVAHDSWGAIKSA